VLEARVDGRPTPPESLDPGHAARTSVPALDRGAPLGTAPGADRATTDAEQDAASMGWHGRLMGDMRNRAWQNIVSALGLLAIAASCYSLLTNLL
jgi:hypothetical protein